MEHRILKEVNEEFFQLVDGYFNLKRELQLELQVELSTRPSEHVKDVMEMKRTILEELLSRDQLLDRVEIIKQVEKVT